MESTAEWSKAAWLRNTGTCRFAFYVFVDFETNRMLQARRHVATVRTFRLKKQRCHFKARYGTAAKRTTLSTHFETRYKIEAKVKLPEASGVESVWAEVSQESPKHL